MSPTQEPDYLAQLDESGPAVAEAAGLSDRPLDVLLAERRSRAGRVDDARLRGPDAGARGGGHRAVVVAPIQFLSDHLEMLYDVDIGAREQAEAAGLAFARIRSLDVAPGLIGRPSPRPPARRPPTGWSARPRFRTGRCPPILTR